MDDKSAIDLAYNPEHHQRSKHIDRRHFSVRERVKSHDITVLFVNSADNLADFFRKMLLPRKSFGMRGIVKSVARSCSPPECSQGGCYKEPRDRIDPRVHCRPYTMLQP
eukprot:1567108-Pleurochrysis_carterae.AAC.1